MVTVQKSMRSDGVTPSARASRQMFRSEGLRSPRSIPPTYVRSNPLSAANSSWDHFRFIRSDRTRFPNARLGSTTSRTGVPQSLAGTFRC